MTRASRIAQTRASAEPMALRVNQVADRMGVSTRTVERWIKEGRVASRRVLGVRLIDARSVKALVSAGE